MTDRERRRLIRRLERHGRAGFIFVAAAEAMPVRLDRKARPARAALAALADPEARA
jgi:hypothetical protein